MIEQKKLSFFLIVVLAISFCLTSCGNQDNHEYEWIQSSSSFQNSMEYNVQGLYGEKSDVYPFAFSEDLVASFSLNSYGITDMTNYVESIYLYSLSKNEIIQELKVEGRYLNCKTEEYDEGADLVLCIADNQNKEFLLWYRWEYSNNTLKLVMKKDCENVNNWTILQIQGESMLVTYDENSNKILAVSGQNECVEVVDLENDELLDLNMDSNGKEILLLVKDQEKARVCVYKDGKCFRSRKLNPEEYIYSMHLLENGVLLNLQYQKADTVSNRLVWWPFEGEEVSVKVNELYRGVSNNHDSVAFMEFSGQNATMHRIVIQNKKCIMESIKLDQQFSSLPQMLLMEKTTDTCGILVASTQKMLRIP